MNTTRVLLKISKVVTTRPRSTAKTSLMPKSLLKSTILKVLKKSVTSFLRLSFWKRHDMPHQTSTDNDPQNIVTHRIWQSTIPHNTSSLTTLDQATKGQIPTLNLPSFQNISLTSTFFQIWRYSFWRFFSVGDSNSRRFDRTFREIRLSSRPEMRSDSEVTTYWRPRRLRWFKKILNYIFIHYV
jgi:hypothetical protein